MLHISLLTGVSNRFLLFALSSIFCLVLAGQINAQTTEFTYQGSLKDGVNLANGNYDFEFALFDALSAGAQVGSTVTRSSVAVSSGIFSVSLDFGSQFPGANRYLELRVRPTGGGSFNTLSPRQQIDSAPYSVKSLNTDSATIATNATQLGGVAASQYVVTTDPRMTDARSPTAGSSSYIQNQNAGAQASSNYNISGTGTANVFNAVSQYNIGGARVVSNPGSENMFVGIGAGAANTGLGANAFVGYLAGNANTSGSSNSFFGAHAGKLNNTGSSNSFFGRNAGQANSSGQENSFFGFSAGSQNTLGAFNTYIGTSAGGGNTTGGGNSYFGSGAGASFGGTDNTLIGVGTGGGINRTGTGNTVVGARAEIATNLTNAGAIGYQSFAAQSNSLILGSINGINSATANTNVGIGTTTPTERLNVVGNGLFTGNLTAGGNGLVTGSLTVNGTLTANLPAGDGDYIQNTTSPQATSNFNISGNGTAGGTLSANIVTATTQYNIGANRILTNAGANNLFAGVGAGQNNTGSSNTAFGANAGNASAAGGENTFFGANAGSLYTTSGGAFFGASAGANSTTGDGNTFIGINSGFANTDGHTNTFLGRFAGNTNTMGDRNTIVGGNADVLSNNLTNATALGNNAAVSASNSLVLGSINGVNGANADTNIGIGTTSPSNRLHISAVGGNIVLGDPGCSAGFTGIGFGATLSGCSNYSLLGNGTDTIISRPTGGVIDFRMGNVSQASINNSGFFSILALGAAGATALCRNASNQISTCSSSLRYKTNIDNFSPGLTFVKKLRPISFDWKDGGMKDVGFGAEEVEKLDPRFVTYNEKGEVEGVKYDRLTVAFVNAFNEQQTQIEKQQAAIGSQQSHIDVLRQEIKEHKAQLDAFKALVCSQNPAAEVCRPTK